jgi:large subunit ribosomal protein L18
MVNRNIKLKKQIRIRLRTLGSEVRPRLAVYKSSKNISIQAIDDVKGVTLAAATSLKIKEKMTKSEKSKIVGKQLAEILKEKNLDTAVFDRRGFKYHGRVKLLADSIRENGIKF